MLSVFSFVSEEDMAFPTVTVHGLWFFREDGVVF